jgi:hypothetical protein
MGKREGKFFRIDSSLTDEFVKICKRKKTEQSDEIEALLKQYIAKDGEITIDDIYAPRIAQAVKVAVDDQVNRIAKMLYNINVDVTSILYGMPAIHKKDLKALEDTIEMFVNPQLLNPKRTPQSTHFEFNKDGRNMIQNLRDFARNDIKQRKNAKETQQ